MIYEVVHITVFPELRDEFIEAYEKAWKDAAFAGSHHGKIMRAIEDDSRVDVLIEWDSVEAHRQHRGTPAQTEFLRIVRSFQKEPTKVQHFEFQDLVP